MSAEQIFARELLMQDGVLTAEYKTTVLNSRAEVERYLQRQLEIDRGIVGKAPTKRYQADVVSFEEFKRDFSSWQEPSSPRVSFLSPADQDTPLSSSLSAPLSAPLSTPSSSITTSAPVSSPSYLSSSLPAPISTPFSAALPSSPAAPFANSSKRSKSKANKVEKVEKVEREEMPEKPARPVRTTRSTRR